MNLFYEVADAPFGLYWHLLFRSCLTSRSVIRANGASLGQRFPFTAPIPVTAANKTLDFSVFEPMNYFPGYDIHNKLPYAEHFNLSLERELSKNTVLTLAYVGTEGHRLITQWKPILVTRLFVAVDCRRRCRHNRRRTAGCGPGNENDVFSSVGYALFTAAHAVRASFTAPGHSILNPNFCPGSASRCAYGSSNTYTRLVANSIYNAGEITLERKASDVTFLAAYTFSRALDNSSAFNDLVNFAESQVEPRAVLQRHHSQLRGQLHLGHPLRPCVRQCAQAPDTGLADARDHAFCDWVSHPVEPGQRRHIAGR